jgi:hypothetical protein
MIAEKWNRLSSPYADAVFVFHVACFRAFRTKQNTGLCIGFAAKTSTRICEYFG